MLVGTKEWIYIQIWRCNAMGFNAIAGALVTIKPEEESSVTELITRKHS